MTYPNFPMTYRTLAAATEIVAANTDDDDDGDGWTFTVEARGDWYVVAVRDETGFLLGYL